MSSPKPLESRKELSKEEMDYHLALVKLNLKNYNNARAAEAPEAAIEWQYGADAAFTVAFFFSTLGMQAYAPPGQPITVKFNFNGKGGAIGLAGGGVAWGTFWCFIDHKDLPGEASYSVEVTPAHISAQFFRNGNLIGHFVGGGPSLALTAGGGVGNFSI
jgi:hypothetical protein